MFVCFLSGVLSKRMYNTKTLDVGRGSPGRRKNLLEAPRRLKFSHVFPMKSDLLGKTVLFSKKGRSPFFSKNDICHGLRRTTKSDIKTTGFQHQDRLF